MTKTCQFHCEPILGVLVVLLSYSTANSDEPKSAAKMTSCHVVGPEIGDVSRILHVDAYRGTFQFDNAVKKVRLVIELYSKGKKLPETLLPAIQCIPQYRC